MHVHCRLYLKNSEIQKFKIRICGNVQLAKRALEENNSIMILSALIQEIARSLFLTFIERTIASNSLVFKL